MLMNTNGLITQLIDDLDMKMSSLDMIFIYTDELIDNNDIDELNNVIDKFITNKLSLQYSICLLTNLVHIKDNNNLNYNSLLSYASSLTTSKSVLHGF